MSNISTSGVIPTSISNPQSQEKKKGICKTLCDVYKHSDAAMEKPSIDPIEKRLSTYMIVDALMLALNITLIAIPKDDYKSAFDWSDEEIETWNQSNWSTMFGKYPAFTFSRAISYWAISIGFELGSFFLALFTYTMLLGVNPEYLKTWYAFHTYSCTLSFVMLLLGNLFFLVQIGFVIQVWGGGESLMLLLNTFTGILVPVIFIGVLGMLIQPFINTQMISRE